MKNLLITENQFLLLKEKLLLEDFKEWIHGSLDAIGIIPGVGDAADFINCALYLHEENYLFAAISAASVFLPLGDVILKGGKWAIIKGIKSPWMINFVGKNISKILSVFKNSLKDLPFISKYIDKMINALKSFLKYGQKLYKKYRQGKKVDKFVKNWKERRPKNINAINKNLSIINKITSNALGNLGKGPISYKLYWYPKNFKFTNPLLYGKNGFEKLSELIKKDTPNQLFKIWANKYKNLFNFLQSSQIGILKKSNSIEVKNFLNYIWDITAQKLYGKKFNVNEFLALRDLAIYKASPKEQDVLMNLSAYLSKDLNNSSLTRIPVL